MKPLLERAASQEGALGCFLSEVAAPNLMRVMRAAGMDFVIIDCEHGSFDSSQVAAVCAVANGIGLTALVRVPGVSRDPIQKALDAGADGILVPMVNDAEQISQAVRMAKYSPLGARGISTMRPHSEYNPGLLAEYMARANGRTLVLAQIETRKGVKNAASIAATQGVDALLVGPNDLSDDHGIPGKLNDPVMQAAYQAVAGSCQEAGKPSGIITSSMSLIHCCQAMGMRIFSCNSEVGLLAQGLKAMRREYLEKKG